MCGIAGILNYYNRSVYRRELQTITNLLEHRGKDSFGTFIGSEDGTTEGFYNGIGLGHRRLSIIDLSSSSAQPMLSLDGYFCITYNGELYNYRELKIELLKKGYKFRTESDTEVVLVAYQHWGVSCLSYFNGMFAFAIWDQKKKYLFCARDQIGIKPFYYNISSDSFRFASESRALVQAGSTKFSTEAIHAYVFSMYQPGELSMYQNIKKLLPGRYMIINQKGEVTEKEYWNLSSEPPKSVVDVKEAEEMMRGLLEQSIKRQLVSDVPVGALLSGGFDSGLLVASATEKIANLHTYSVGFDDGIQQSELDIAKSMAQRYGTIHHERIIRKDEIITILDKALLSLSEPLSDSAIVPTYCLSEMAASDGVKVLLSGTGGDEVFGGYSRYVAYSTARKYFMAIPQELKTMLGNSIAKGSITGMRMTSPVLDMMMCAGGAPDVYIKLFQSKKNGLVELENLKTYLPKPPSSKLSLLYQQMQADIKIYLPDLLLILLDQITMAHTIEGRVPYLDIELIKASFSLPSKIHVNNGQTRLLQKKIAKGVIDDRTFTAKKQGFSGPVSFWIESNKKIFQERIMAVREIPGMAELNIEELVYQREKTGLKHWHNDMFALYCLATWYYGQKS